jgi:hypothetical protein
MPVASDTSSAKVESRRAPLLGAEAALQVLLRLHLHVEAQLLVHASLSHFPVHEGVEP